ncbi:S8 family serine peptidase [Flavobacterium kingsejongi]|uniref:Peptidase S8/S53 domain-containing protein n=1 Tax=Flavobacterium kingsejongi TaxID=1678728 RepID=A0A2S1LKL2_9FLAO|nr:S8 family serine peptidase [Flavobacterium kingsejongi]AWG24310.1 hypothetical protein FK004_03250 [Flavobacterium kingsejongi]
MNKDGIILIIMSLLLFSCTQTKEYITLLDNIKLQKKKNPPITYRNDWQHKDIIEDTIPGISLDKAYRELLKDKKGKTVVVAIIDTEMDIFHEDLKDAIWINPNEIPDNGIDDDDNGYIDDIHGWNFLGNQQGGNIIYSNLESTRIIRKFQSQFQNVKQEDVLEQDIEDFLQYQKALIHYKENYDKLIEEKKYGVFLTEGYKKSVNTLSKFFPEQNYTLSKLDSIYALYKENKEYSADIYYMKDYIKYNLSAEWISNYNKDIDEKIATILNDNYEDRKIQGDDPKDLSDIHYGNNNVFKNAAIFNHSTKVAGLIAATRNNELGIKGVTNNVTLMALCVKAYSSEHDKDVALAIRYAVDNGAQIINISLGKRQSLHPDWIQGAIRYAAEHDVLIVCAAGNESTDLDGITLYPNDEKHDGTEISHNFIKVGSISYYINEWFVSYFSNYGKGNVDVFAPGHDLFTTIANNKYEFDSGTSLSAPIVSGVAALIRSYYPTLTAAEVKSIILESGISYDIMVNRPAENGSNDKIHFSELSKSGKVVNAYNALLMAKEGAKKKKKKKR